MVPADPFGAYIRNNQYIIGRLIGSGECGKVYKTINTHNMDEPLVIKISADKSISSEIKAIKAIQAYSKDLIYGKLIVGNSPMKYFIMPRYGMDLSKYLKKNGYPSKEEVVKIGL